MKMYKTLLVTLLFTLGSVSAWSYSTGWMTHVVQKQSCLESLGSVVSTPSDCWSFTRSESATPLYDAATSQILVGGTDALLHVVNAKNGKIVKALKLEGNLSAAPVQNSDKLVLFATDKGYAYALKQSELSSVWKTELDSGVLLTPVLFEEKIFFVTQMGTLYALSQASGEVLWFKKRELPNRIFLRHLSTPMLFDSQVSGSHRKIMALGNPNGKLDFLDPENGNLIDAIPLGDTKDLFPDVAATSVSGGRFNYTAAYNYGLVAIDAQSRIRKWDIKEKGITQIATQSDVLVMAGSKVVVGANAQTGEILWRFDFKKGAPGKIVIHGGEVFVASDTDALYVLDMLSGKQKQILGSGLGIAGGIEIVGDNLLAMSSAGSLFMFNRF